jgi:hypothetical protein
MMRSMSIHSSIANQLAAPQREKASYLRMAKRKKPEAEPDVLKGWQQIAAFLGQPVSVAQRWATEGMPVKREGALRRVVPSRTEPMAGSRISWGAGSNCYCRN